MSAAPLDRFQTLVTVAGRRADYLVHQGVRALGLGHLPVGSARFVLTGNLLPPPRQADQACPLRPPGLDAIPIQCLAAARRYRP